MLTPTILRLGPVAAARRDAFHGGRDDDRDDPVLSRWRRARDLGRDPDDNAAPVGVGAAALAERKDGLAHAVARADDVTAPLLRMPVVALLADRDGVVVWSRAAAYQDRAVQARLVEGACWAEAARGTNAIGTALAERRDVAVVGSAHYERVNERLFCYATPLIDPYDDLLGVLDVSGDVHHDDPALAHIVQRVGAALREALRADAWAHSGGLGVVERMLDRCAVPALLIERSGVRRMNDRARAFFGDVDNAAGLFGASFDSLAHSALEGGDRPTLRGHRLHLEPVLGHGGRVLSVVACLDPITRRAPRIPAADAERAFAALVGDDDAIRRARTLAARFAPTPLPVLLLAETGTGKELLARAIHQASPRAAGPFVAINCGALSPQLLESELFGFAPGSFTGARTGGGEGKIAAAHGGTLFLDEMAEMSPALQAMLLRVLEDGSYTRVGETHVRRADFRLIAATCRDLPALMHSGAFRSDLYHRMHGATLTLPPLRERTDRLMLARALLEGLAADESIASPMLADDACLLIEDHPWPGNVRELKNALRHALVLSDDGVLRAADFPVPPPVPASTLSPLQERLRLDEALKRAGGNRARAARELGVARSTLYRMLDRQRDPS